MFASKDVFLTPPSGGYTIGKSVRLRSSASAYFNRTPSSSTNRRISTFSAWIKWSLTGSSAYPEIFSAAANGLLYKDAFYFSNNTLAIIFNGGVTYSLVTTQVFRDPSAWYHFVMAIDTTQATASNRVKLYVNGLQITAFSTANYPIQNYDPNFNSAIVHNIGRSTDANDYYDGYMAEINFIDGQQLTPSSFGTTNATTGVWQPAKYTGTYGTNGFYLNFSSNGTSAALGTDFSGNSNTWTVNNVSVTAGVTYDSMLDSPTVSATSSNYCVSNPLDKNTNLNVTNGNLQSTGTAAQYQAIRGTFGVSSGKWYFEATITANNFASNGVNVGVGQITAPFTAGPGAATNAWMYSNNNGAGAGRKINGATSTTYGATYTTNDVIGVALDLGAGSLEFYKNGTSQGVAYSSGVTGELFPFVSMYSTDAIEVNFGQRPFTYTPPTGFVALNTYNLPASTITNGAAYMAATLYTGNGSTQTVSNAVNGVSMQPDFVWVKSRQYTTVGHSLFDVLRPIGANTSLPRLVSNTTDAETNNGGLTAFVSNGFSLNNDAYINSTSTGGNMVAWQWKAGGAGVSNTNGSITSTVSVGATQGFSVVTYTGNGGASGTIGHGLGVAPSMIIIKNRTSSVENWVTYHSSLGATSPIYLNLTLAAGSGSGIFNSTAPTSSVFSVGSSAGVNAATTYVAYCFATVKGFSAFGSYTPNNSSDGPFIYLGFRPRWLMIKNSSAAGYDWTILDSSRTPYNLVNGYLLANASDAEATGFNQIDILSNGFKIRQAGGNINPASGTIIYAAFCENPFKNALAR